MRIGVPKEIKTQEYRVGLTPESVGELVRAGHEVVVETNAGNGLGATDADYQAVGAKILPTAAAVWITTSGRRRSKSSKAANGWARSMRCAFVPAAAGRSRIVTSDVQPAGVSRASSDPRSPAPPVINALISSPRRRTD